MFVVGVVGAYTLVFLVHGFLRHHKLIAAKTDAVYEIVYGEERSEMAQKIEHEVRTQAKHEGEIKAQQMLELAKRQEREVGLRRVAAPKDIREYSASPMVCVGSVPENRPGSFGGTSKLN